MNNSIHEIMKHAEHHAGPSPPPPPNIINNQLRDGGNNYCTGSAAGHLPLPRDSITGARRRGHRSPSSSPSNQRFVGSKTRSRTRRRRQRLLRFGSTETVEVVPAKLTPFFFKFSYQRGEGRLGGKNIKNENNNENKKGKRNKQRKTRQSRKKRETQNRRAAASRSGEIIARLIGGQ